MQMKNRKISIYRSNEKGITLIALIITIIVLIIVAGVAINMTIGEDGIITKSRLAKEKEEVARLSEKLELQKANIRLDNNKSVTLDNFLEQLKLENIIEDIDIDETGEENSRYIEVEDKYIFLVIDLKNGDVQIEYEGRTGKLIPKIKGIEIEKVTTSSITVKVSAIRADEGNYKYYIKNITDKKEYEVKETSKNEEYTFTSLEQNKEYKIQVEVTNKNGSVLRETEGSVKTTTVQELTSANINFTYTPNYWTNETVTASVSLKSGIIIPVGSRIQTSKDAKEWSNSTSQEFNENGNIYVRVWDGTNGGGYAVGEVSKIDTDEPEISAALASSNETTKAFTLSIGVTDAKSGIGKIVWYYKKSTEPRYTSEEEKCAELNGETAGVTTVITKTKQYDNLTSGTYNAYVEVYDVAGNKSTSSTINITLGTVTALSTSNIKFSYNPSGWTNGKVTAKAELNGITLKAGEKLQISTNGSDWEDGTSKEYSGNGRFYVRVTDGINIGDSAAGEVSKIDTTKPVVTNVTSTTSGVTITATDEASGIVGFKVTTSNAAPSSFDSCENTKSLTKEVSGLKQNTTYYVWVKDEAENVSLSKSIATGSISQASGASYTPTNLTNGDVTVTLPTISGLITKYTTDGSTPTTSNGIEYTTTITISNNCTIKYIYTDGNNIGEEGILNIGNIDKINPTTPTISLTTTSSWATKSGYFAGDNWTYGSVIVNLSSTDSSGIQKYQISSNNSDWVDISGNQYTFSDKGAYTRYFRAIDNAGNVSSSSSTNFTIYSVGSSITLSSYSGKTITLFGSDGVPCYDNAVNLEPNKKYQVEFDYVCASGTNQFDCDLWPDDLPQICPIATTTQKHAIWILTSSSSNMKSCSLRFFDDIQEENESDITITNITLKEISI